MNSSAIPNYRDDLTKLPDVVRSLASTDCYDDIKANEYWLFNYYARPVTDRWGCDEITDASIHLNGYNLSRKAINTAVAVLCRQLRIQVDSVGGDYTVQRNAKVLTRISDGIDDACGWRALSTRVARTGMICHLGAARGYMEDGEIKADWVNPQYLTYNSDEEEPTEIFYSPPVPRRALIAKFPKHKESILKAAPFNPLPIVGAEPTGRGRRDCVQVHEVVCLADGENKGIRAMVLDDGTILAQEEWKPSILPYAFYRWSPSWRGIGGISLASEVASFHRRLNDSIRIIMASARGCIPRVSRQIDEPVSQVSDFPWEEVLYDKIEPKMEASNTISQQILALKAMIESDCFSYVGISEMIASNTRPAGLNSEPSQLAWMDIANVRMYERQVEWEAFNTQWMRIKMALAMTAYKSKGVRVKAPGSDMLEEIKWPAIAREDQYSYRAVAGSGLPLTLSGKLQTLSQFKALAPEAFTDGNLVRALGSPDVEAASDSINAAIDCAMAMVDGCLDDGIVSVPSQMQGIDGLTELVKYGSNKYQRAVITKSKDPANVELLRIMILHAQELLGIMNNQGKLPPAPPVAPVVSAPISTAPIASQPTPYLAQGGPV